MGSSLVQGRAYQLALFEEGEGEAPVGHVAQRLERPRFDEPSPEGIRVGGVPLEVHLRRGGTTLPLRVRKVLAPVDLSAFEERYSMQGRPAFAPRLMLGLALYGLLIGRSTLRELERLARADLGCMWVAGGIAPDHAAIGRFLVRHADQIRGPFFEELTGQLLRLAGGKVSDLSGDGTVMQAMASRYRKLTEEAARKAADKARAEASASPSDPAAQAKAEAAEKVAETATERTRARAEHRGEPEKVVVSPTEPEAVFQRLKTGANGFAYKPSVLANDQGIVVATALHPTNETAVLEEMIEQATRVGDAPVERVKVDAGYFADETIRVALEHDIDLLCPEGRTRSHGCEKRSDKHYLKNQFVYDSERDVYMCPAGQELRPFDRCRKGKRSEAYTRYRTPACDTCPLRAQCVRGRGGRTVKRYANEAPKDALREVMRQPRARAAYRRRAAEVEPVFASLRQRQGLQRFHRCGLAGAALEWTLNVLAHNLSRAIALLARKGNHFSVLLIAMTVLAVLQALHRVIRTYRGTRTRLLSLRFVPQPL